MVKTKEGGIAALWETSEVMLFCDLCITEIGLGNRPTTHLSKEGWKNVTTKFQERTSKMYVCAQFKNKWDQLKKDWKLWKELKHGATGLGWDSTRRTVDASDDWWKERLEVVPAAKKFRYAGIPPELEEKLYTMFNEVVATGDNAWAPNSRVDPSSPEHVLSEHEDDVVEELGTPAGLSDDQRDDVGIFERGGSSQGSKRRIEKGRKGIQKNRRGRYTIEQLVESTIRVGDIISQPPQTFVPSYTIHEAVDELEKHPDICNDPALYDFATIFLLDNKNRELFLSLPNSKKGWWLKNRQYTNMHSGGL
ncbi:hypothetical protein KSP39_PZI003371 [Platanthera zijinensis]|uniref:Myb/SANT-like domain-containing protein n=1 Tax=Platanthera zijinensis TaxID=2320716 RepID=A0AAP0BWN9_9ASPA